MKRIVSLLITCLFASHAFGQARPGAYLWTLNLKVVDDNNQPVRGAKTWVAYGDPKQGQPSDPFQANDWAIAGLTDTNGFFTAKHIDHSWSLGIQVQKAGYYPILESYELYKPGQFDDQKVAANRNASLVLTIKKIIKPIPMYAKRIDSEPPANGTPVGYDLMVGDWVGPYGKGINTDIIFAREYNRKSFQDYDYKLTVSFPKAGDGIQEFPTPYKNMEGSALRSPHEAPTNGYLPQITRLNISHPGQKLIFDHDENRVYLFRVRAKIDNSGNIVSAHYGKIYGDFMQFTYYFNPTANDRDIEFDLKQNLMANLKTDESVSEP